MNIKLLEDLRSEKAMLEAELAREKSESLHLKQELDDAKAQKIILTKAILCFYFIIFQNLYKN